MSDFILAIDVGTTTLTVLILDLSTGNTHTAKSRLSSNYPTPGLVEQDAGAIWDTAQKTLTTALQSAHLSPNDICAIGVTTQRSSIIVWDEATGTPITPMVVWSDQRGKQRAQELTEQGFAIIMISSELPEIIGMCDRVAVFNKGAIVNVLQASDINPQEVMRHATGSLNSEHVH